MIRSMIRAGVALALTAGSALAAPAPRDAVVVTAADLAAANRKVEQAFGDLAATWEDALARLGARFAAPDLVRYRGAVATACGVMRADNAGYCIRDNTIYYDEIFVAGLAKRAGSQLGTDGDMAAVGVIAHEMGHAVAMQLGHLSRYTYQNEATADCLAGAFAHSADERHELEAGDVDEAFWGMASAGDPTPQLTGDQRVDRAILVRASLMGHGSETQRMANFRAGLQSGAGACLAEFR
jgi:hypothetical protein